MQKRIRLRDRILPDYSRGEEIMNMVTHIVGGGFGIIALVLTSLRGCLNHNTIELVSCIIYCCTMIALYSISSIYHGMHCGTGKKVMQIIDHCAIYFLIAGTYTPILLCVFVPAKPVLGWSLLAMQWGLACLAATLTAIDLKKYNVFSMICYILMGWCIIFFLPVALQLIAPGGFSLLLLGGVIYTIGAVLYGIGSKVHWMHSVFHIFVVAGSISQFLSIYLYML